MGLFSFLIASSEMKFVEKQNNPAPQWFEILAEAGFNQTFLAGIHSLMVCSFLPQTCQIGTLVHVVPLD